MRYEAELTRLLRNNVPHPDLESATNDLTNIFLAAAETSIPRKKRPKRQYREYWFTDDRVREMNRSLNAARKNYRRSPTRINRDILNDVREHACRVKAGVREEKWFTWCESIDGNNHQ